MYSWYQKADICYVYLSDYHYGTTLGLPSPIFRECRWFRRGWTLQELIAPESVIFFNSKWHDIGTKHSLGKLISDITKIQVDALLGADLGSFSVAQRMCWASRRETTRIEDEAYSLMGIFGVHMPMLYGEGENAFIRLQEEIIKKSTDHTIFAWPRASSNYKEYNHQYDKSHSGGLLATSPSAFSGADLIIRDPSRSSLPFEMTNKGMHLCLPIYQESIGILDCQHMGQPGSNLGIDMFKISGSSDTFQLNSYPPVDLRRKVKLNEREKSPLQSVYIVKGASNERAPSRHEDGELFYELSFDHSSITLREIWPHNPSVLSQIRGSFVFYESGKTIRGPGRDFGALVFTDQVQNLFAVVLKINNAGDCELGVVEGISSTGAGDKVDIYQKIYREGQDWRMKRRKPALDRFLWQHPVAKWWISVGMRRAIVSGKRTIIVTIKDEPK